MNSTSPTTNRPTAKWVYPLLLAAMTIGAGTILSQAVPAYRAIVINAAGHTPSTRTFIWSIVAVTLVQGAYWTRLRIHPSLPNGQVLLGHVVKFLGRVSFIATTAIFSMVFIRHPEELDLPLSRLISLLAVVFSMFCYNLELDDLGNTLKRPRQSP